MVTIRHARPEDIAQVTAFYQNAGYRGSVAPSDQIILAEDGGALVGLVRLAPEHGVTVLRGMRVAPAFQYQGIGTRLLEAVRVTLGTNACYCIPYAHLVEFYERIGFREIAPSIAPPFLADRLATYRRERPETFTLMYRHGEPAGGAAASAGQSSEVLVLEAISPSNRTLTLSFLAACGLLAGGAAAIGVSDNLPGIVLAFLAATAFVLACVHPWRTAKQFRFLAAGSALGFVIFLGLSAMLDVVAKRWATVGVLHGLLRGLSGTFLLALMICPPAFVVGAAGGVALGIRDRRRSRQAHVTAA